METFSAFLAICAGNSQVSGEFPVQRPVARSFDVFFDLRLNKRLSKQSWSWSFETLSRPLLRHRNVSAIRAVQGDCESIYYLLKGMDMKMGMCIRQVRVKCHDPAAIHTYKSTMHENITRG